MWGSKETRWKNIDPKDEGLEGIEAVKAALADMVDQVLGKDWSIGSGAPPEGSIPAPGLQQYNNGPAKMKKYKGSHGDCPQLGPHEHAEEKGTEADLTKGDVPGHEFHGNQYSEGATSGKDQAANERAKQDYLNRPAGRSANRAMAYFDELRPSKTFNASQHEASPEHLRLTHGTRLVAGDNARAIHEHLHDRILSKPMKELHPAKSMMDKQEIREHLHVMHGIERENVDKTHLQMLHNQAEREGIGKIHAHERESIRFNELKPKSDSRAANEALSNKPAPAGTDLSDYIAAHPGIKSPVADVEKHSSSNHYTAQERDASGSFGQHFPKHKINRHTGACPCRDCQE